MRENYRPFNRNDGDISISWESALPNAHNIKIFLATAYFHIDWTAHVESLHLYFYKSMYIAMYVFQEPTCRVLLEFSEISNAIDFVWIELDGMRSIDGRR